MLDGDFMFRLIFLLLFGVLSPLSSFDSWDDEEDSPERSFISYGGMGFYCDRGCGDSKYDSDADSIEWLYTSYLKKPLYTFSPLSWNEVSVFHRLNLSEWKEGQLFDTSLREFFYDDEFSETYSRFLEVSSDFLGELDQIYVECQKKEDLHIQNLETIETLRLQGFLFIDYETEEITGCNRSSWRNISIENAVEFELDGISHCQFNIEKYERYRDYAKNTLQLIDSLYRKIFVSCLENHQPEGVSFKEALEYFIVGDYFKAIEQIKFLLSVAEKKGLGDELLAKLYLLQGQIQSEYCLYSDAMIVLTSAIQKNPSQKEAYLERAVTYFELGKFDLALEDYLASGFKSNSLEHQLQKSSISSMSAGIAVGIVSGAAHSGIEFIPQILSSCRGMGHGLWAFSKDPVGASQAFIQGVTQCVEYLRRYSSTKIIQDLVPELKELVQDYDQLSDYEKGNLMGRVIGKYGTDIFLCKYSVTAVKAYRNMKRANQLMTLEMLSSSNGAQTVLKESVGRWALREKAFKNELQFHEGRQGKHLLGHKNYVKEKNKSVFTHPERNRLLKNFGGTGVKELNITPGMPGFVEVVDFEETIGWNVNLLTGEKISTSWGKIHYAKDGVHIVPTLPRK